MCAHVYVWEEENGVVQQLKSKHGKVAVSVAFAGKQGGDVNSEALPSPHFQQRRHINNQQRRYLAYTPSSHV